MSTEPMSEERLKEIEKGAARFGDSVTKECCAEIRRLRRCQQEDWCPGVPVACQKHYDQATEGEQLRLKELDQAKDLLLERARQADENLARIRELEWAVHLLIGSHDESVMCLQCRTANELLAKTPAEALTLQRARLAVVEAAKDWRAGEQPVAHAFALQAAIDALEKLESPTSQANENPKTGQEKGERA